MGIDDFRIQLVKYCTYVTAPSTTASTQTGLMKGVLFDFWVELEFPACLPTVPVFAVIPVLFVLLLVWFRGFTKGVLFDFWVELSFPSWLPTIPVSTIPVLFVLFPVWFSPCHLPWAFSSLITASRSETGVFPESQKSHRKAVYWDLHPLASEARIHEV